MPKLTFIPFLTYLAALFIILNLMAYFLSILASSTFFSAVYARTVSFSILFYEKGDAGSDL